MVAWGDSDSSQSSTEQCEPCGKRETGFSCAACPHVKHMARPCWGQGSHVLHSGGSWSGWLALGLSPMPPPFPLQPLPASMCVLSHFSCVRLFVTPRTVACEAPLRELLGFSRQGYLSGLPLPPPRGLPPAPRTEAASLTAPTLASRSLTASATWETLAKPGLLPPLPPAGEDYDEKYKS